jgi:N6-L-threonylcarbamoyladenine synthase
MLVLGIETSCDETGVALFDTDRGLLANQVHSQIALHREYGGVVPELASRDHISKVVPIVENTLHESGCSLDSVGLIAVTAGPGLGGALLAGNSIAAGLAFASGIPVMPIHHMEAHLLSPLMVAKAPRFPFVALLVSGGHTQLMAVEGVGRYRLLGETLDDAAGEAFDKTATLLGLSYPGGAALADCAARGDPARFRLPRPMMHSGDLDFSFSGLKTAVLHLVGKQNANGPMEARFVRDVAAAFESAIVDVLVTKSIAALRETGWSTLVVAGGVSANLRLRARLDAAIRARRAEAFYPPHEFCTDNGAMVAHAAALRLMSGAQQPDPAPASFNVRPRWPL